MQDGPDAQIPLRPRAELRDPGMIAPGSEEDATLKEIKVRIPVNFHLKLHAFKVLKGKPISDTIVEALDAYFKAAEQRKRDNDLAREAAALPAAEGALALEGGLEPPRKPHEPLR